MSDDRADRALNTYRELEAGLKKQKAAGWLVPKIGDLILLMHIEAVGEDLEIRKLECSALQGIAARLKSIDEKMLARYQVGHRASRDAYVE